MVENSYNTSHNVEPEYDETPEEKAGWVGLIFSFLFPIVGVIIYFVQRSKVINPGNYLIAAGCGFLVGLLMRVM